MAFNSPSPSARYSSKLPLLASKKRLHAACLKDTMLASSRHLLDGRFQIGHNRAAFGVRHHFPGKSRDRTALLDIPGKYLIYSEDGSEVHRAFVMIPGVSEVLVLNFVPHWMCPSIKACKVFQSKCRRHLSSRSKRETQMKKWAKDEPLPLVIVQPCLGPRTFATFKTCGLSMVDINAILGHFLQVA